MSITNKVTISLVKELKNLFPNKLPLSTDYFKNKPITPEQIAFEAGRQSIIDYLEQVAMLQEDS